MLTFAAHIFLGTVLTKLTKDEGFRGKKFSVPILTLLFRDVGALKIDI
jgi:hypothetical protein